MWVVGATADEAMVIDDSEDEGSDGRTVELGAASKGGIEVGVKSERLGAPASAPPARENLTSETPHRSLSPPSGPKLLHDDLDVNVTRLPAPALPPDTSTPAAHRHLPSCSTLAWALRHPLVVQLIFMTSFFYEWRNRRRQKWMLRYRLIWVGTILAHKDIDVMSNPLIQITF